MTMINPFIFREYDIRGNVADDLHPDVVELLGRGFGTYALRHQAKKIALSGDVRLSTPSLIASFRKGLISSGVDVINLGILPTPANYFSMYLLEIDGAVQITGSHNPPEFNGFKLSLRRAAVYGEEIQKIKEMIDKRDFETGAGSERSFDLNEDYVKLLTGKIRMERPLKIAMDCGNAAACLHAPRIFEALGAELTKLYCDVDGNFPNHHPDPTVDKNLADLVALMQKGGHDIGIAFDGDADRVGIVDNEGHIVRADVVMAILVEEMIKPGDQVIFDVKCSQALEETIFKHGGKPLMWKTGHSIIKQKMREDGAKLGGELSGHIFIADDFFGYDDAIYVALRIAQLVSRSKVPLSEIRKRVPAYHSSPEIRFSCPDDAKKFQIAKEAAAFFKANYECIEVDGVRVKCPSGGWGLVRASNTQPEIVCRFEAHDQAALADIERVISGKLSSLGARPGGH
ncbi:MAG: phosphomannomutase/phosphoglucomutase [Spirochaetia bacterium]|nr:phosphomannomutase/phosphoglucomutase [Spirochaetia bacterium]